MQRDHASAPAGSATSAEVVAKAAGEGGAASAGGLKFPKGDLLAQDKARRQARLAKARAERRTKRWIKQRRYKPRNQRRSDRLYLKWIERWPCALCGTFWGVRAHHEPAKGKGGCGDWHDHKTIPLCAECHIFGRMARHRMRFGSCEAWEQAVGISTSAIVERLRWLYLEIFPRRRKGRE